MLELSGIFLKLFNKDPAKYLEDIKFFIKRLISFSLK